MEEHFLGDDGLQEEVPPYYEPSDNNTAVVKVEGPEPNRVLRRIEVPQTASAADLHRIVCERFGVKKKNFWLLAQDLDGDFIVLGESEETWHAMLREAGGKPLRARLDARVGAVPDSSSSSSSSSLDSSSTDGAPRTAALFTAMSASKPVFVTSMQSDYAAASGSNQKWMAGGDEEQQKSAHSNSGWFFRLMVGGWLMGYGLPVALSLGMAAGIGAAVSDAGGYIAYQVIMTSLLAANALFVVGARKWLRLLTNHEKPLFLTQIPWKVRKYGFGAAVPYGIVGGVISILLVYLFFPFRVHMAQLTPPTSYRHLALGTSSLYQWFPSSASDADTINNQYTLTFDENLGWSSGCRIVDFSAGKCFCLSNLSAPSEPSEIGGSYQAGVPAVAICRIDPDDRRNDVSQITDSSSGSTSSRFSCCVRRWSDSGFFRSDVLRDGALLAYDLETSLGRFLSAETLDAEELSQLREQLFGGKAYFLDINLPRFLDFEEGHLGVGIASGAVVGVTLFISFIIGANVCALL